MADRMTLENGQISVTTEEGASLETTEATLHEIMAQMNCPPLGGQLLPDGVKGLFWDPPHLVLVHQASPKVLPVTWITNNSPVDFGPGTQYRKVRLSFPYAITFASFVQFRGGLQLTGHNELYFRNQPVRCEVRRAGVPGPPERFLCRGRRPRAIVDLHAAPRTPQRPRLVRPTPGAAEPRLERRLQPLLGAARRAEHVSVLGGNPSRPAPRRTMASGQRQGPGVRAGRSVEAGGVGNRRPGPQNARGNFLPGQLRSRSARGRGAWG